MTNQSVFHQGELAVQQRANESHIAFANGQVISDMMPPGAVPFVGQQAVAVLASIDENNNAWSTILIGKPGFITATDVQTIILDKSQLDYLSHDPLWTAAINGGDVGLIVIDFATRRRLRVNGHLSSIGDDKFKLSVVQAYPNCPKYIQRRYITINEQTEYQPEEVKEGNVPGEAQLKLIKDADTFFVASANPSHGVDSSHRGGGKGFVQVVNDNEIIIPDYHGNSMYNTLGNFEVWPHAGVTFIDFESKQILQMTGDARILWDQNDADNVSGGTKRFWRFTIKEWRQFSLGERFKWELQDYSPFNPIYTPVSG